MSKKLTKEEFNRRVKEAMQSPNQPGAGSNPLLDKLRKAAANLKAKPAA